MVILCARMKKRIQKKETLKAQKQELKDKKKKPVTKEIAESEEEESEDDDMSGRE